MRSTTLLTASTLILLAGSALAQDPGFVPPMPNSPRKNVVKARSGQASASTLAAVQKIFVDKMDNNLDQYVKAEIMKQFKGRLSLVTSANEADGIMTGVSEQEKGTGSKITGRYLGLHDVATGSVTILDRSGKNVLWVEEAGDRSLIFGAMKRGGQRRVADRLVHKLKKAMGSNYLVPESGFFAAEGAGFAGAFFTFPATDGSASKAFSVVRMKFSS